MFCQFFSFLFNYRISLRNPWDYEKNGVYGQIVALIVEREQRGQHIGSSLVYRCLLIHTDPEAQIGGLVVDAAVRRSGAGHRLMQAAEQWAREQGCWAIYLRSNVTRKDAHQFYQKMGYETVASSVFRKRL